MTATNHALTGAIIGLSLSNPYLAIPLAFASHFALDALPHFTFRGSIKEVLRSKKFLISLIIDVVLCFTLAGLLIATQPPNWKLGVVCAFTACSPDLLQIGRFIAAKRNMAVPKLRGLMGEIHERVQWFERPIGAFVEAAWFATTVLFLRFLVR